jgi:nickel-dependent lactate racemase
MLSFSWNNDTMPIPIPEAIKPTILEAPYPNPLDVNEINSLIQLDMGKFDFELKKAKNIVLIVEDSSRMSNTKDLVRAICNNIQKSRGNLSGFEIIIAAGAHYEIYPNDLFNKIDLKMPFSIHDCKDTGNLITMKSKRRNVPFLFNKKVVQADLRFTISTMNIHPLVGLSGGGKALLPGIAGLQTIEAFHSLPPGKPGNESSPMRELIKEVLEVLPIHHSWHLLSNPDGYIVKINSGKVDDSFHQSAKELLKLVTVNKPNWLADILFLGCRPFNQNLIGTFKSLHQIPKLLKPAGKVILLNEAPQGIGFHHWRTEPQVIATQKNLYQQQFNNFQIGVFSPQTTNEQFRMIFPETFQLLKERAELLNFIEIPELKNKNTARVIAIPFAPITLIH